MKTSKKRILLAGGLIGSAYGVAAYFLLGLGDPTALATVSFLALVPVGMASVPLLFTDDDQVRCYRNTLLIPWLSVFGTFVVLYAIKAESVLCLAVLSLPFVLVVSVVVWVVRALGIRAASRRRRQAAGLLLLLPFLTAQAELRWMIEAQPGLVERSVEVAAAPAAVWRQIVEVAPIERDAYDPGLPSRLGVPRPLFATVDRHAEGGWRTGVFENGLRFRERMTRFEIARRLELAVSIDPASVPDDPALRHALAGGYLRIGVVAYDLQPLAGGGTRLTLSCRYTIRSSVNAYGHPWARAILGDFEQRLLPVIRDRAEAAEATAPPEPLAAP